jgi:hypothetical protein
MYYIFLQWRKIKWNDTGDPFFPYQADYKGHKFKIRVNDFPEEVLFTLFDGEKEVMPLEGWPAR